MAGQDGADGTPFGRYRLLSVLGEGGMGEVWRAHDTVTDRVVAIKVLSARLSKDEDFQRRFRREAHAAARLETPHVVPIHDYGEIDGRLFVCMRLIKGRDLAAVLADGPLEPGRAVRIIGQVAEALHAAHEIGLIHRDIKPSNILLDDRDFAYLIDFGIARVVDDTRITKTGNTIGTFAYIAPERLHGEGEENARADIYSLACVLYECLTGKPPFNADTMPRLIVAHMSSPPPRPSITRPEVPPQVDEVIATGMAKDPDQRYATTIELADAARDAITAPIQQPNPRPTRLRATEPAPGPTLLDEATRPATPLRQPRPGRRSRHPEALTGPPQPVKTSPSRKILQALIVTIVLCVVIVIAFNYIYKRMKPNTVASPTPTAQPIAEAALEGLLLSPDQLNTAMGIGGLGGLKIQQTSSGTGDASAMVPDKACLPLERPAEAAAYAGSGWSAMRGQHLQSPLALVDQYVVLFPSAHDADAFFTASANSWQACSGRQFTNIEVGQTFSLAVGPLSNVNGMLSATRTQSDADEWHCQRALTAAKNVAIDILACSRTIDSAVTIAQQIAAKVP